MKLAGPSCAEDSACVLSCKMAWSEIDLWGEDSVQVQIEGENSERL